MFSQRLKQHRWHRSLLRLLLPQQQRFEWTSKDCMGDVGSLFAVSPVWEQLSHTLHLLSHLFCLTSTHIHTHTLLYEASKPRCYWLISVPLVYSRIGLIRRKYAVNKLIEAIEHFERVCQPSQPVVWTEKMEWEVWSTKAFGWEDICSFVLQMKAINAVFCHCLTPAGCSSHNALILGSLWGSFRNVQ